MAFFNYSTMQMTAKIVYYGPGLGGKTTNLEFIHGHTTRDSRGEMVSLETQTDRTLFFDLLPLEVGTVAGFKTRVQLYTVPGQVFYNTTRKLVLKGVDGVVFVADSQRPMLQANRESLDNLAENLQTLSLSIETIPMVLQYNKRDLKEILSVDELEQKLNRSGWPSFEAIAISGRGVFETLRGISKLTLIALKKQLESRGASRPVPRAAAPAPAADRPPAPQKVRIEAPSGAPRRRSTPATPAPATVAKRHEPVPLTRGPLPPLPIEPRTPAGQELLEGAAGSPVSPLDSHPPTLPAESEVASDAAPALPAEGEQRASAPAATPAEAEVEASTPPPPAEDEVEASDPSPPPAESEVEDALPAKPAASEGEAIALPPPAARESDDEAAARSATEIADPSGEEPIESRAEEAPVEATPAAPEPRVERASTAIEPPPDSAGDAEPSPTEPAAEDEPGALAEVPAAAAAALGPETETGSRQELQHQLAVELTPEELARVARLRLRVQVEDEDSEPVGAARDLEIGIDERPLAELLLRLDIGVAPRE